MSDYYPGLFSEPETRHFPLRVEGAGTGGSVSKAFGAGGIGVTYVSTGIFDIDWDLGDDPPGQPMGIEGYAFQAATPANVKGYSATAGNYNASTRTIRINIWDAANSLVDLKANEAVNFRVIFRQYKGF